MAHAVFRAIGSVDNDEVIVDQVTLAVSEHLWVNLDFSTDETFKDPSRQFFPDAGEYDILVSSNNGVSYSPLFDGMKVTEIDYEPLYHNAGLITNVKAFKTVNVTKTFAPEDPNFGLPIFVRVTTPRL